MCTSRSRSPVSLLSLNTKGFALVLTLSLQTGNATRAAALPPPQALPEVSYSAPASGRKKRMSHTRAVCHQLLSLPSLSCTKDEQLLHCLGAHLLLPAAHFPRLTRADPRKGGRPAPLTVGRSLITAGPA